MQKTASIIAGLSAFCFSLLGGIDDFILLLFLLMISDYVTGLINGYKSHNLNSNVGFMGIIKKIVMLIVIAIAYNFDLRIFHTDILRTSVITFYVVNETLSVIENIGSIGVPLPKKLKEVVEQLNDEKE